MAAAELKLAAGRRLQSEARRVWLEAYGAIWATTLIAALIIGVIQPLRSPARELLNLRLGADQTPTPGLGHVASLAAHNFPVAAWPALLGATGAHSQNVARRLADALLACCIAANVVPVGAALGAYGPALLPYIPQLPLEWAALALGASTWLLHRRRALTPLRVAALLALTGGVLICAATIETFAVPHEQHHSIGAPANSRGGLEGCPRDIPAVPLSKEPDDATSRHGCPLATPRRARPAHSRRTDRGGRSRDTTSGAHA